MMNRLKEIEARVQAATDGPWGETDDFVQKIEPPRAVSESAIAHDVMRDGDRIFIAHAREDIPWLLAEVRRLREGLEEIADSTTELPTGLICQKLLDGTPV